MDTRSGKGPCVGHRRVCEPIRLVRVRQGNARSGVRVCATISKSGRPHRIGTASAGLLQSFKQGTSGCPSTRQTMRTTRTVGRYPDTACAALFSTINGMRRCHCNEWQKPQSSARATPSPQAATSLPFSGRSRRLAHDASPLPRQKRGAVGRRRSAHAEPRCRFYGDTGRSGPRYRAGPDAWWRGRALRGPGGIQQGRTPCAGPAHAPAREAPREASRARRPGPRPVRSAEDRHTA